MKMKLWDENIAFGMQMGLAGLCALLLLGSVLVKVRDGRAASSGNQVEFTARLVPGDGEVRFLVDLTDARDLVCGPEDGEGN